MIEIGIINGTPVHKIINIRDKKKVIKAMYCIDANDVHKHILMAEHHIEISFSLNKNVSFKRSDYIEWEGDKYTLRNDYKPEQVNKREYKYTLKFEAVEMFFQDMQYWYLGQGLKESELRMTGNPEYFLKYAVENANRYFKTTEFNIGTVEPTEIKDITFEVNTNTFDALTQIADVYGAEWYITGKTIHLLNKVSFGDEVDFETEVSVLSMKREEGESTTRYTRILALGSTRNIPYDYRETTPNEAVDAVYPKRLRIPASKGDVIDAYPNMSPDEVVEGTVIFDEVYPRREGTIEAVGTIEYQDVNEDTGEITKWNAYKFKDSGINFKKEYLLPGQELKLQFTSGDLNGRHFALIFHEKGFSSSNNSQFYEIVRTDEFGKLLPNDIMKPKAGDKYVLYGFNIALVSDQYVPAGEKELYDVAVEWQKKQLRDTSVYECPTVIKHFMDNQMDLAIGQKVRLIKDLGGNKNLLLNSNFANGISSWVQTTGYSIVSDERFGKCCKVAATSNSKGIFQKPIRESGKEYAWSVWLKADAPMKFQIMHEGGTGSMIVDLTTEWQLFKGTGIWNGTGAFCLYSSGVGNNAYIANVKYESGNKTSDWTPAPEDKDVSRSSRIMGFEKKLNNKFDAIYTVGDNSTYSRFGKIEQQIKELQVAGIVYENTGGSGVYVIKQFDTTRPTDFNVYSAIASDAKYFNKQTGGTVQGDTTFAKNMQVQGTAISEVFQNSTFTSGQFGSGFQIKRDANGQSYMEVDNLLVRRETVFNRLTIAEIKSVGGTILLSLASMVLSKVEVKASTWKCFFDTADGTIPNDYAVGDQAICRKFTGKDIKYYWALVTAVGADYIELSRTDKDGSGVPAIGDEVVQLGNRSDVNRQYAIMLSAYGSAAPSINQYAGINSYDLTGKEVTAISPKGNKFTGSFTVSTNGTTAPVYKERGVFVNGTAYYLNDRVSYLGSYWVCIVNTTITTPSEGSSTWRKDTAGQSDINNAINNIQVGGRNLLLNSNFIFGISSWTQTTSYSIVSDERFGKCCKVVANANSRGIFQKPIRESGKEYAWSVWLKADAPMKFQIVHEGGTGSMIVDLTTEWQLFKGTGIWNGTGAFCLYSSGVGNNAYIANVKYESGNKTSDWTPAPEDVEKQILDAETKANQAQIDADKANSIISDIANDNKLTPNEKQIIAKDWGDIQKEYPSAISEANKFGVSTTAYTNAYNALNSYITPLLADLTTTNDIVGATFRLRFNSYRDEYVKLLNAIASKTKELADAAQTTANNAQSTANQAKTDASNAQSAANKAQTDANTANNLLTDIASDNKLTPNEKQETKKEWDAIASEYPKNIAQANKFGVATTAYTTAYNALNSYITPLLANLGTTSDINGATFRATFKAYYDARTDLLNAISTKAKELADKAQTTADNAQKEAEKVRTEYKADFVVLDTKIASKVSQTDFDALGNRVSTSESNITQLSNQITSVVETVDKISIGTKNLLLNSNFIFGISSWTQTTSYSIVSDERFGKCCKVVANANSRGIFQKPIRESGKEYAWSVWLKADAPMKFQIVHEGGTGSMIVDLTTEWQLFKGTGIWNGTGAFCLYSSGVGNNAYIANVKYESGNKTSDWTPAPEDVEKQIQDINDKALLAQQNAENAQGTANQAKNEANQAQTDANTANNLLTDIASDNKLTPNEKQETKKEWDAIASEYPKNIAQANKFGVATTAYTTAYNALNSYITPLLTNLATTSDINGATFRATFKAYYDARTDLLNAISTKAKELADAAQSSANNAQNTADSKNRTYYQDAVPTAPSGGHKVGDLWYKTSLVDSSGNINADTTKNIYQLQYRWDGTTWRQINWSVSKSKIEQTDSSISMIVEKTGINSVGAGSSLYSMILQTENEIKLEVGKIQIGGRNLLLNSNFIFGISSWTQTTSYSIVSDERFGKCCKIVAFANSKGIFQRPNRTGRGEYSWSVWLKADAPMKFQILHEGGTGTMLVDLTTEWQLFKGSGVWNGTGAFCLYSSGVGNNAYIANAKYEEGNKATDWTPAPEDTQAGIDNAQSTADSKTTLDEVSSSLTITDNKISLASKTIELTGHTIAKSIEAQDLKVGSRTGLSALEVLKDGTFYAKGSTSSNSALIIDSGTQSITITSPKSASGEGSPISGSSNVTISSQSGGVRVDGSTAISSNSVAVVSNSGIFANTAGQGMYPSSSAINARASIVGLGWGNIAKDSYDDRNFVAGVYGSATNRGSAPAFGGYFDLLRANGLYFAVRQISSSTTLDKYDCYVSCYNMSAITVYLPSSPYTGQVVYLRQMNSNGFTIHSNSGSTAKIHTDGNVVVSTGNRAGRGDTTMLVYDGQYWNLNYMAR